MDYHVGDKYAMHKRMQAPNYNFKCLNPKFLLSLPQSGYA